MWYRISGFVTMHMTCVYPSHNSWVFNNSPRNNHTGRFTNDDVGDVIVLNDVIILNVLHCL